MQMTFMHFLEIGLEGKNEKIPVPCNKGKQPLECQILTFPHSVTNFLF